MCMNKRYTWLWDFPSSELRADKIVSFCRSHNVGTIFLHYPKNAFDEFYSWLIKQATAHGIEVHATAGEPLWALPEGERHIMDFLQRVKHYNESHLASAQFTGIHFDIEPHTLRKSKGDPLDWEADREQIVWSWTNNVDTYTDYIAREIQVPVSCTLQFSTENILIGPDKQKTLTEYMIDRHDKVVVMAYRNFAQGHDSIIYHAQNELNIADGLQKPNSVIVAVETTSVEPSKVTFAGTGRRYMYRQLDIVDHTFMDYKSYAGHAIHHLMSWMDMPV